MCATVWCHLVNATEATAGLVESNDSLSPGGWLKVTCRLTVCTPGQTMRMGKLSFFSTDLCVLIEIELDYQINRHVHV